MSELKDAAHHINTAWCKGDLRKEEQARSQGDTYCAVGALAYSILPEGMMLSLDGEYMGDEKSMKAFDILYFKKMDMSPSDDEYWDVDSQMESIIDESDWQNTYEVMDDHPLVFALARVVAEKYADRVDTEAGPEQILEDYTPSEIVFQFNDHASTKREEVVDVFLEADKRVEAGL